MWWKYNRATHNRINDWPKAPNGIDHVASGTKTKCTLKMDKVKAVTMQSKDKTIGSLLHRLRDSHCMHYCM